MEFAILAWNIHKNIHSFFARENNNIDPHIIVRGLY
jgi:hypothetical protein